MPSNFFALPHVMRSTKFHYLAVACLLLVISPSSALSQVTFTKIVDVDTLVPGQSSTFEGFTTPRRDGNDLIFTGRDANDRTGLYRWRDGTIEELVSSDEFNIPMTDPSISGVRVNDGVYVFRTLLSLADTRLYRYQNDGFTEVTNSSSRNNYSDFSLADDGSIIHPFGIQTGGFARLFADGSSTVLVNGLTTIPEGTGTFEGFSFFYRDYDGSELVFRGDGENEQFGIYGHLDGSLQKVVDTSDIAPGRTEAFAGFASPAINNEVISFFGGYFVGEDVTVGFYQRDASGNLSTVVDNKTPYPGAPDTTFESFGIIDSDGMTSVFTANNTDGNSPQSLFARTGNDYQLLLSPGDMLEGKEIDFFGFFPVDLEDDAFTLAIRFTDDSRAAFLVELATATLLGDVDLDGDVDFADIPAFIAVLQSGDFQAEADCDESGVVDFSDIPAFIAILIGS